MSYHGKIHVMSFGLGGNHGDGVSTTGNTYTTSWYLSSPEQFVECIPGHYDPSEVDGCVVIDKREILDQKPGLAYRSPMCNAKLSENEVDRFSDLKAGDSLVLRAFAQGDATQRTLAALAALSLQPSAEPGPLDYVSPVTFAAWWRKHGGPTGEVILVSVRVLAGSRSTCGPPSSNAAGKIWRWRWIDMGGTSTLVPGVQPAADRGNQQLRRQEYEQD